MANDPNEHPGENQAAEFLVPAGMEKAGMEKAVLCFVDPRTQGWAWFTTGRLKDVTGNGWNRQSYEHHCSCPDHGTEGSRFFQVGFQGEFLDLKEGQWNSPYSVNDINAGATAWLRPLPRSDHGVCIHHGACIHTGTTLTDFITKVHGAGGQVYLPTARPNSVASSEGDVLQKDPVP